MFTFLRLIRIMFVSFRYGLDELVISGIRHPWTERLLVVMRLGRKLHAPRGDGCASRWRRSAPSSSSSAKCCRRGATIPADIADELARLQDRVPPFPSEVAIASIRKELGRHPDVLFASFEREPVASASIAQVHFAVLKDGREVAVKVLRPNMAPVIDKDLRLLRAAATLIEKISADGRRLKPREVVAEFDKYLHDELDLLREAANCSQLRRNFAPDGPRGDLLIVPEVMWDYCSSSIFTMERMRGIPVNHTARLVEAGVDLKKLARDGVEICFTQMFADGFFHADMHPGNIYVSDDPRTLGRYIALDFGIVGSLSEFDKNYLAQNFLAFFRRDYRQVARLHIESGWCRPARARKNWKARSGPAASLISTGPWPRSRWGRCCCACSRPRAASTSRSSRNWCCCRRRCSTSKGWGASWTRRWTCGRRPSLTWNAG